MKLKVYLNAYQNRLFVGLLEMRQQRLLFEYAPEFLEQRIELSPFHLPLRAGVFEEQRQIFDGLFGVFNDSLPDGWGAFLLDRHLRKAGTSYEEISPLRRLMLAGVNAPGALEYEPEEPIASAPEPVTLDMLAEEIASLNRTHESAFLDTLVELNSSSGGARPKVNAWKSPEGALSFGNNAQHPTERLWMIKFPTTQEGKDFGEIEYRVSLAAKEAGITMAETQLFPSNHCAGYFGTERFDRTPRGKVHLHTACGLLHASHRYSSLDYTALLKLTAVLTKDQNDIEEMVRRMVFNVLLGNRDDHSKNFAFCLDENAQWRLAPAYDLTPSSGINGEHTAMVNGKGREITAQDLIKTASLFHVSDTFVRETIARVADALRRHAFPVHLPPSH